MLDKVVEVVFEDSVEWLCNKVEDEWSSEKIK